MKDLIEFNIGDTAYKLNYEWVKPECNNCSGTGRVSVTFKGNEIEVQCPICNGKKRVGESYKEYTYKEIQIEAIKIEKEYILYASEYNWDLEYDEWDWIYEPLYKTKEEAELDIKIKLKGENSDN